MSNGFVGPGQSVKVLNINDLSEENSIAVAKGAASMDFDSDNNAWVSSTEAWDSPNGFLTKIAPDASVSSQEITSGSTSLAVVDGALYYTTGSALESMNLSTNEVNTLTPGFFYGKAHSSDGNIYLSSPGDFASPAYVIKTDQNGMVLDTFDVGITPGFIYISE